MAASSPARALNTAARLESDGAPSRVDITEAVRNALPHGFNVAPRRAVDIHGKGPIDTYWPQAAPFSFE
ncbi:MAG: adenylate/guanylate cyclase domain-containing protein [Pseudomonadota bacterium]